ncbi:MAG: restriction endonuclease subunit S [Candidatus Omnitrophica bacterium]|jgi:type I restriction enzyme S subunit|nr:restriction endonuclease subunit S [Candidatus Omnitrophota bacterium]MCF7895796.1 restriction endonuclease subunit S [Candidatus Omnitrophota bacterium]MCF7898055.1 restriction endonuclease subunit S [Candidatus Omnitrophota bacterium]
MKCKISFFLKERQDRFKPKEAKELNLQRIEKITQNGEIFISDKPSNTNMILVKPGDLTLSGIGIAKGGGNSLNVYEGNKEVLATIHYSSYEIDEELISKEFLKIFLRSPYFRKLLQENCPGGIKAELKPKHFLPIELDLPSQEKQENIVQKIQSIEKTINQIVEQLPYDENLLFKLKQAILQEAMQGKLVKQDPKDEAATELLKKIKTEKGKLIKEKKIKKSKPLPPITKDEIPYELPKGWGWCRLQEAGLLERGKSKHRPRNDVKLFRNGIYPLVQTGDVAQAKKTSNIIKSFSSEYNDLGLQQSRMWRRGTLCVTIAANIAETGFLGMDACFPDSIVGYTDLVCTGTLSKYIAYYIASVKNRLTDFAPSTAQKNINLGILNFLSFPMPPQKEQKRIIEKLDRLMKYCDALEGKIKQSKTDSEKLMQAVLQETFEN